MHKLPARHGLARMLSKMGVCSRTCAAAWIRDGRVRMDGRVVRDPEFPVTLPVTTHLIEVDGNALVAASPVYIMLNKPRGLVTTVHDERGRDTVYRCLENATLDGSALPWLAPVGRLDKASEGLLLLGNDPAWGAGITDPASGPDKTYHVHIDRVPDAELMIRLVQGIEAGGEYLSARSATLLRIGDKHAWLEVVLAEGRNRHIRRLLAAFDIQVLRLVRVAIGALPLGPLAKGQWRRLQADDLKALATPASAQAGVPAASR